MKMSCEFCGVRTSSFGLVMGAPLRSVALDLGLLSRPKCALNALPDISPRWGTRCVDFGGAAGRAAVFEIRIGAPHHSAASPACVLCTSYATRNHRAIAARSSAVSCRYPSLHDRLQNLLPHQRCVTMPIRPPQRSQTRGLRFCLMKP